MAHKQWSSYSLLRVLTFKISMALYNVDPLATFGVTTDLAIW